MGLNAPVGVSQISKLGESVIHSTSALQHCWDSIGYAWGLPSIDRVQLLYQEISCVVEMVAERARIVCGAGVSVRIQGAVPGRQRASVLQGVRAMSLPARARHSATTPHLLPRCAAHALNTLQAK